MSSEPPKADCAALKCVMDVIGDRWSVIIIWSIKDGPQRFNDIQKILDINTRTLSQRLQMLEEAGLLEKHEYKEYPPRVEYELTDKGRAIQPIWNEMTEWAATYGTK